MRESKLDFAPTTYRHLERFRLLCWLLFLSLLGLCFWVWHQSNTLETERNSLSLQSKVLDTKLIQQGAFEAPKQFQTNFGANPTNASLNDVSDTNFTNDAETPETINALLTHLNKDFPTYAFLLVPLFEQLEKQAGTAFQITDLGFDAEAGRLSLSLKALDFEAVENLKDALQATKLADQRLSLVSRISDQRREQQTQSFGSGFGSAPQNLIVATIELSIIPNPKTAQNATNIGSGDL